MSERCAICSVGFDSDWRPVDVILEIPLVTVSEANSRAHWAVKARRAKSQRELILSALQYTVGDLGNGPATAEVRLTRIGPRKLDTDNITGAQKHTRDAVAEWLNIDDGDDERISFVYDQEPGTKKHRVRIAVAMEW